MALAVQQNKAGVPDGREFLRGIVDMGRLKELRRSFLVDVSDKSLLVTASVSPFLTSLLLPLASSPLFTSTV
jgi:hypothetical protein